MKKVIIVALVFATLLSGIVISCKKVEQETNEIKSETSLSSLKSDNVSESLILSEDINDFNYIGEMHNTELEKLILKTKGLNSFSERENEISNYYFNVSDNGEVFSFLNKMKKESPINLLESLEGKFPNNVYTDVYDFLNEADEIYKTEISGSKQLSILKDKINLKKIEIYQNYNGNNLFLLKTFYSVYLNSLIYWTPKEFGGLGKYNEHVQVKRPDPNINVIASADAVGGLGAGIVSFGNPLAAIVGAAVASINKAL